MIGRDILHYHILAKLGEGGMGVVYRARDSRLDRDAAIKHETFRRKHAGAFPGTPQP